MAIKKYSKVKFTLRKELIIILAAIVVLVVATILFNLPNEEEKFLTKWNENGAQITENHLYEEVSFDELKGILNGKGENERVIDPAEMFLFQDGWYCAAFCERKQDIRHFELKRIIKYELLDEKYE